MGALSSKETPRKSGQRCYGNIAKTKQATAYTDKMGDVRVNRLDAVKEGSRPCLATENNRFIKWLE